MPTGVYERPAENSRQFMQDTVVRGKGTAQIEEWLDEKDDHWAWADSGRDGGFFSGLGSGVPLPGPQVTPGNPTNGQVRGTLEAKSSVLGCEYPRISPKSSELDDYRYGNALIRWAEQVLEIELMPWQKFVLREGCCRRDGRFKYRTVLTIVARQNGKTLLAAIRVLGGMVLFGERMIVGAAQNRQLALESCAQAYGFAEQAGLDLGRVRRSVGSEEFWLNGARYKVAASTSGGGRGLSGVDLVLMDEIRELRNWNGYAALDKTRRARPDSQLWAISTEGDLNSVVLNRLQTMARDAIALERGVPIGYFEWSAPIGAHPGVPETWAMANPALGWTLDERVMEAEYLTDPPEVFETEVLCRKVANVQSWLSVKDWDACVSDESFPTEIPFVIAIEAGPELRHVSIIAGAYAHGFHHLEVIGAFAGPQALTHAEDRLRAVLSRWEPAALVTMAKSPCEASVARLAAQAKIPFQPVRPAGWARACRAFYAAVDQRRIRHPGGGEVSQALGATRRGPDGLLSSVHRVSDLQDNDAALAAILALWSADQIPDKEIKPTWTVY